MSKAKVAGSNLTPEVSNPLLSVKLNSNGVVLSTELRKTEVGVRRVLPVVESVI
jgi:hypothetical protein